MRETTWGWQEIISGGDIGSGDGDKDIIILL